MAETTLRTVGVLGTEAVMNGECYHDRSADHGIDTVVPEDRALVDGVIVEELGHGEPRRGRPPSPSSTTSSRQG